MKRNKKFTQTHVLNHPSPCQNASMETPFCFFDGGSAVDLVRCRVALLSQNGLALFFFFVPLSLPTEIPSADGGTHYHL